MRIIKEMINDVRTITNFIIERDNRQELKEAAKIVSLFFGMMIVGFYFGLWLLITIT